MAPEIRSHFVGADSTCMNTNLFNDIVCKLGLFFPRVPKNAQFTHERDGYNIFLFDEPLTFWSLLQIA
jgi:hypothetical protein